MPHRLRIDFLAPIAVGEKDTVESLKEKAFEVMGSWLVSRES
jgi:hypothetical protein